MTWDRFDGAVGEASARWSNLDSDWKGVLVGAAITALVGIFGVDVPW